MVNTMEDESFVNTRVVGRCGILELNRPRALNSLTPSMIQYISEALLRWEKDDSIAVVMLTSTSERAFCAGGDVRWVRERDLDGDFAAGDEFFRDEYALNLRLSQFNKPIVALLESVVMGGGLGISAHGSHRVITARTRGAMPEAAIGFIPDVGMSYALTHMPIDPAVGLFIACTGWRLNPADMLYTGLGNVLVEDTVAFAEALGSAALPEIIAHYRLDASTLDEPSQLQRNESWIVDNFRDGSWVDIAERIQAAEPGRGVGTEFLAAVHEQLASANPSSLVATVELFRRSATTDMATALENEWALGCLLRRQPNFAEGVRAVLVDKDRNPTFHPSSAAAVDAEVFRRALV